MSIVGGSVTITVNADGSANIVGTGLALAHATALVAARTPAGFVPLPSPGDTDAPFSPAAPCSASMVAQRKEALSAIYAGCATEANAVGPAWATYLTAHASVSVSVPAAGLLDHTGGACSGTATGTGTIS